MRLISSTVPTGPASAEVIQSERQATQVTTVNGHQIRRIDDAKVQWVINTLEELIREAQRPQEKSPQKKGLSVRIATYLEATGNRELVQEAQENRRKAEADALKAEAEAEKYRRLLQGFKASVAKSASKQESS